MKFLSHLFTQYLKAFDKLNIEMEVKELGLGWVNFPERGNVFPNMLTKRGL